MVELLFSDSVFTLFYILSIDLDLVQRLLLGGFNVDEPVIAHLKVGVVGSDAYASKDDLGLGVAGLAANIDGTYQEEGCKKGDLQSRRL